jgi:hypothetical protein
MAAVRASLPKSCLLCTMLCGKLASTLITQQYPLFPVEEDGGVCGSGNGDLGESPAKGANDDAGTCKYL